MAREGESAPKGLLEPRACLAQLGQEAGRVKRAAVVLREIREKKGLRGNEVLREHRASLGFRDPRAIGGLKVTGARGEFRVL